MSNAAAIYDPIISGATLAALLYIGRTMRQRVTDSRAHTQELATLRATVAALDETVKRNTAAYRTNTRKLDRLSGKLDASVRAMDRQSTELGKVRDRVVTLETHRPLNGDNPKVSN